MAERRAGNPAGASSGGSRKKPIRARSSGNPRASLEGHYRTLLDIIPQWVLETDAAGVVTFANRAYEEGNGWRAGEVVGKSIFELPPTSEARASLRNYFESLAARQPEPTAWFGQARNQQGEPRDRRVDWRYLRDENGKLSGFVAVVNDITEELKEQRRIQEQLDLLETMVDSASDIIYAKDLDSVYHRTNRAGAALVGRPKEEVIGRTDEAFLSPERAALVRAADLRVLEGGEDVISEIEIETPTGVRVLAAAKSPYRDADGRVIGLVGVARDITEQWKTEQALRESEERFRTLSESLADCMVYQIDAGTDGRERHFTYLSPVVEHFHGVTVNEAMRDPSLIYGQVVEDRRADLAEQEARAVAARTVFDFETQVRVASGELRWRHFVSAPRKRPDGHVVWSGIERDITDRKLTENRLRDSEAKYRLFLENFTGIAYQFELRTYRPLFFHGRVEEITGYTGDDFTGGQVAWEDLVHPDDLGAFAAEERVLLGRPGYVSDTEYRIQTRNGELRWVRDVVRLLHPQDSGTQVLQGAIYDITERKRAEEGLQRAHEELESRVRERTAELEVTKRELELDIERREKAELEKARLEAQLRQSQALEAVGRLAGGVAHDFNNLLGSVLACASVARRSQTKPKNVHRELRRIEELCKQGGEVTRQLLAVARQAPEATVHLDLKRKLEELKLLVERVCPKTVSVVFEVAEDLPSMSGDRGLVTTAFLNVCLNARDAMPAGGTLTVRARREQGAGKDWAVIQVTDTGEGIPKELQEQIFQPFFSTKSVGRGAGLGLPTALATVQNMGGTLDLESKPGCGSTFTFRLPASPEPAAETSTPRLDPAEDLLCLGTKSALVLLVEDEDDIARFVTEVLARHGCQVLRARTGLEALGILREREDGLDLLLLDLVLPELSGEIIHRVLTASASNIPVVFVTGREDLAKKVDPRVPLLRKPFSEGELLECARKAVGGSERLNRAVPA